MGIKLANAADVEPTFLPEGWEIKVVGGGDDLDGPAPAAQLISVDEKSGRVVAIVGVTGIVDHVGDLIEPGAYADTLKKRRPKVCWAHAWESPVGRVDEIEEWSPGDRRFAEVKATLDGKPWPSNAGALVAAMTFNLKSDKGRDAFEAVDFYSESGECEWSIGWQTVAGQTTRRKDGVRVCKKVELYEVSPVLFGAAPLTRTLQVKSIRLDDATRDGLLAAGLQLKASGPASTGEEYELHAAGLPEIDWDEVDQASGGTFPDGTSAAGSDLPGADPDDTGSGSGDDEGTTAPQAKGFVLDAGALDAVLASGDFGALAAVIEVEAKADTHPGDRGQGDGKGNKGNAHSLIKWYIENPEIAWGTDGDFMRCVGLASKHMTPERAKGFCNLRHRDATGASPGHAPAELAAHGATNKKSAGVLAAEQLAKSWNPLLEVGDLAAHTAGKSLAVMDAQELTGTFEQRRRALDEALTPLLRELNEDAPGELAAGGLDGDGDRDRPVKGNDDWVSIDGTFDDHVVATYVRYDSDRPVRQTYDIPYSWDGEDVTLGEPAPVQLQVSIVPMDADGDYDGDGPGEDDDADATAGPVDALIAPALLGIDQGIGALKSAFTHSPEVKVGKVMSASNMTLLQAAIEHLVQVAKAAGVDLAGLADLVGTPNPTGIGTDPAALPDTTAPATPGTGAVAAAAGGSTQVKVLTQAQLDAELAELVNFS